MYNIDFENKNIIFLNSARNCLRYLIRAYNIQEIQVPFFICQSVRQAISTEKIKMKFYHIDKNFMPVCDFHKDDYILYPNYFGICSKQNEILSEKYINLISDNAHSFYANPSGLASFYSPRKFLKVNDGGILFSNKKTDEIYQKDKDRNIKIIDFNTFCKNEISLDNEPIKIMSEKTKQIISSINYDYEISKRTQIFSEINETLGKENELNFNLQNYDIPYVYPFLHKNSNKIAEYLDKNGIYLIKYGSNLPKSYIEYDFSKNLILIPLTNNVSKLIKNYPFTAPSL